MNRFKRIEDVSKEEIDDVIDSIKNEPKRAEHLSLLAGAFFDNLQRDNTEYGGWGLDSKRPFGNSFVEGDIADIIDLELPSEDNKENYEEMIVYINGLYADLAIYVRYKWKRLMALEAGLKNLLK